MQKIFQISDVKTSDHRLLAYSLLHSVLLEVVSEVKWVSISTYPSHMHTKLTRFAYYLTLPPHTSTLFQYQQLELHKIKVRSEISALSIGHQKIADKKLQKEMQRNIDDGILSSVLKVIFRSISCKKKTHVCAPEVILCSVYGIYDRGGSRRKT